MNTFVSPSTLPLRFDAKTSRFRREIRFRVFAAEGELADVAQVAFAGDGRLRINRAEGEGYETRAERERWKARQKRRHAGKITRLMSPSGARAIRVLFVCHFNRKRSATAERVFGKEPGLDVRSAGTSDEALVQVNQRMLEWADIVFIMDEAQRVALAQAFPEHPAVAAAVCLDISDDYHFLDPTLIGLLRERVIPHLARLRSGVRSIN